MCLEPQNGHHMSWGWAGRGPHRKHRHLQRGLATGNTPHSSDSKGVKAAGTPEKTQDGRGNKPEEMAASSQRRDSRWRRRGYDRRPRACGAAWPGDRPGAEGRAWPGEERGAPVPPASPAITTERVNLRSRGAQARQRERRHPNPRIETQPPCYLASRTLGRRDAAVGREGPRGWVSAPVKPQQAQPRGRERP